MPSCGAPNCTNRSTENKGLSFHRLPSNNRGELREKWPRNIKRQAVPESFYVCSEHFENSCFKRDLKSELLG